MKMLGNEQANDFQEILSRKKALESEGTQPLPLRRVVLSPQPFPFEALGPLLGVAAQRIHEVVQTSDAIAAQSVLAAAALATQPFADIYIDGRVHPLSLFLLTVAESGDRKSAVDRIALKPVYEHEKRLSHSYQKAREEYKIQYEVWQQKKQALLKEEGQNLEKHILELTESLQPPPLIPACLVEEPTFEGLQCLFAEGQPSLGLFCDEGGRMFGGFSMKKEEQLKTASGLSSFWDGKPSTRVRAKGNSVTLYGKRLSLHLMLQESVFNRISSNELLKTQGFLARCLVVYPESRVGQREYQEVDLQDDPILKQYWEAIEELIRQPFPLRDPRIPNELQPRRMQLTKIAKSLWKDFHNDLDKKLRRNAEFYTIRRFASKAPEQVLRIAGIFTVFNRCDTLFVSEKELQQAIMLMNFYLSEAFRIENLNQDDSKLEIAQELLSWLENYRHETEEYMVPISVIYQKGPSRIRNKSLALELLYILEDHGYGKIVNNQIYKGRRHRIIWKGLQVPPPPLPC